MMQQEIATQLRVSRAERGLSLEELSLKTRIGTEKLLRYETGEEIPTEPTLLMLSNALEIPLRTWWMVYMMNRYKKGGTTN